MGSERRSDTIHAFKVEPLTHKHVLDTIAFTTEERVDIQGHWIFPPEALDLHDLETLMTFAQETGGQLARSA
jgi:hypothetical protein